MREDRIEEKILELNQGRNDDVENDANEWLEKGVGKNKRSTSRDIEKMLYESGLTEDLEHYDPTNDWDTKDSAYMILADDIANFESTICASVDDVNVRSRSRADPKLPAGVWGRAGQEERRGLYRHIGDDEDWGSSSEDIPLLGVIDGERKTCAKCKRTVGVKCFSPDARNKDGLHSWCKPCRKEFTSQKRRNSRLGH